MFTIMKAMGVVSKCAYWMALFGVCFIIVQTAMVTFLWNVDMILPDTASRIGSDVMLNIIRNNTCVEKNMPHLHDEVQYDGSRIDFCAAMHSPIVNKVIGKGCNTGGNIMYMVNFMCAHFDEMAFAAPVHDAIVIDAHGRSFAIVVSGRIPSPKTYDQVLKFNVSGIARDAADANRKLHDMFAWFISPISAGITILIYWVSTTVSILLSIVVAVTHDWLDERRAKRCAPEKTNVD